ncbi:HAD-IA family hydrolase [Ancylothrix sp. C2]|uniref:HAD-IA family hydrolase n=1 Tax=Ancylothrix sp. D3o TaxID=2953691 RepID=UPI0021BA9E14|nr:HAD-IA family hydrolase [Ancylothrix sp. D3o]MCT7949255.1 HAD-IA family hydrolase [Ancylothrix sp. D3o]
MAIKLMVFDFDGTLVDTFEPLLKIVHRLADEFGYPAPTSEQIEHFKNLPSREIIKCVGVDLIKIPYLLRRVKLELNKEMSDVKLIPGIQETLTQLKQEGVQLGIITSNSKDNVLTVLEKQGGKELFNFIYAETSLFGKHRTINKLLKQQKNRPDEMIYVGDETRDIEAAKKSKIKVIAVSWGFNSKQALLAKNPDFLIDRPQSLAWCLNGIK